MSYLNQDNVFSVASAIYNEVKRKYGMNVEGYYLEDIQSVMQKLWEKNKDKSLKQGQTMKHLHSALNKKSVEIILPQVFNNIEAGYLNKTQNNLFLTRDDTREYAQAQQQYRPPQMTNDGPEKKNVEDTQDAFERLKKQRESEGNYAPALQDQRNVYSSNSYQNKQPTYDNQLPMTPKVSEDIQPDVDADRFDNGKPIYNNDRQNRVRDAGPTNAPGFFTRPDQFGVADSTGPSLDSFFNSASNLRGVQNPDQSSVIPGTNQNTTREAENLDVEDKFSKLKSQYLQDGKLNRPKDTSNSVEDVVGKRIKNTRQFTEHFDNKKESPEVKEAEAKMKEMALDKTTKETFFYQSHPNQFIENSVEKARNEMILNNQLSENATLNYPILMPNKQVYQTRKYYITVDSLNRDLEAYPNPANFQVRFEQPGDEIEIPSFINEKGVVVYKRPVLYQNVGGRGATIESIYTNVVELKCTDAEIPLEKPYVGGLAPYVFNGPEVDLNKAPPYPPNQFTSFPYGPVFQANYGIYQDVYDEPYYFLVIDEIDGAYDGTSLASRKAVAKLNYDKLIGIRRQFVGLKTSAYEGKVFYPTTLAKLSQMTLQMVTRFNQLLDVGVDKVYIKSIERGEEVVGNRYCPLPPGTHLTKITIVPEDPSYGQVLCSVGVRPGDRLLFYSIFNCDPLANYTKLGEDVYINFDKYPIIYFYMVYDTVPTKTEKKVDVRPFLSKGDLVIINNKYVLQVDQIDAQGLYVKVSSRNDFDPKTKVFAKGIVNVKKSGNNVPDKLCFLSSSGQRVGGTLDEPFSFQLLYPFESLPDYLKSAPYGFYQPYEAFYIHALKQISYTFEITQVEQSQDSLESRIVSAPG